MNKPICIVGGGLAGLTLGIGLRQRGIPVTIWEANRYPRHRVCGEFISGRGQDVLARLGLRESVLKAGAMQARTAAFFPQTSKSPPRPLPQPAICVSRFVLDDLLARIFRDCGGDLAENQRWRDSFGEGIVCAGGRRPQPVEKGARWFGLKAHAQNLPLAADLEMHSLHNGYVGLCRLKGGEVNVCGLFRRRGGGQDSGKSWQEMLRGPRGTILNERLAGAIFDATSFCSVAALSLKPQRASARAECCIGDALTMTPPVTGNGMSIAFESAEIAIRPLADYSQGRLSWPAAQQSIARACDQAFARRLAWSKWLQWMMFSPLLQSGPGSLVLGWDWFWRLMFAQTRS